MSTSQNKRQKTERLITLHASRVTYTLRPGPSAQLWPLLRCRQRPLRGSHRPHPRKRRLRGRDVVLSEALHDTQLDELAGVDVEDAWGGDAVWGGGWGSRSLPSCLASHGFEPPAGGFEELRESATDGSDPFSRLLVLVRYLLSGVGRKRKPPLAIAQCAAWLIYGYPSCTLHLCHPEICWPRWEIVAAIEGSEAKTWIECQNAPPQSSILELAKAIVEECCARKASVEQKYKRCLLQHRMHEAAVRKVEDACAAAERAISALSARCHV
ncbi:hypothetical protein BJ138DRAFT_1128156 [Hygrophoropsis aurantiaca]|uniref:Uncharacterized protein n=1 Tax=Hygrophoropsis aurantiaca TaxID=72124 RepID=A0ACB8A6E8_9AGAM|nr:hypothetical protein BJ138DRAFT_1128156 [Hygrophoropsis aurantiaca]